MNSPRFWAVFLLLGLAGLLLYQRGDRDIVPPSRPLSQMPYTLGAWNGTDLPIADDTLQVLGKGDFMNRIYTQGSLAAPNAVGLLIAYFPTQRSGQSIHSPQHCLPGAGWTFESSGTAQIPVADGKTMKVGDYLITNGASRDEVLYWYQSHGRAIADDYVAKFFTIADSIRYNRTDAALVRIVVPIQPNETRDAAHQRAVSFAQQTVQLLPGFIPN